MLAPLLMTSAAVLLRATAAVAADEAEGRLAKPEDKLIAGKVLHDPAYMTVIQGGGVHVCSKASAAPQICWPRVQLTRSGIIRRGWTATTGTGTTLLFCTARNDAACMSTMLVRDAAGGITRITLISSAGAMEQGRMRSISPELQAEILEWLRKNDGK